ncbi:MAG TPA: hypothetical protein DEA51_00480 [Erysipelotrichaceae bacterium]|nr:hypothetical protein [Erysipelotrichaceae bacterium]
MNPFEEFLRQTQTTRVVKTRKKLGRAIVQSAVITLIIFAVVDYITLPAYTFHSPSTMFLLAMFSGLFGFLVQAFSFKTTKVTLISYAISALLVSYVLVGSLIGAEFLRATAYRDQITIKEMKEFNEEFETIGLNRIPVVDKQTAVQLGDKQLGTVSGLGSQFFVDSQYSLINVNDGIFRVSPLDHRDFFKWLQNRNEGIQNYVSVNVTNPTDVRLVAVSAGMKVSPNSFFNQDLARHVRFKYRTLIFGDYTFEIDDDQNPYWVVSVIKPEIGPFGGLSAQGAVLVNPVTMDTQYYDIDELPHWVDRVQPSSIAWSQIDNWGYYVHGFINTLFNQKDMLQTTDGYNYVVIDNQVYVYSGLTSLGGDRSIVGFTLINLKSKEATFYQIGGADEYAAMASAEGQVQHLNYRSTFPVLLNISNTPTYFVSLKDQEGLVKKYSFIAVSNYDAVGVGDTVAEAQRNYILKLREIGMVKDDETRYTEITGTVAMVSTAIVDGNSVYYITLDEDPRLFVVNVSVNLEVLFTTENDEVTMKFFDNKENIVEVDYFDHLAINFKAP